MAKLKTGERLTITTQTCTTLYVVMEITEPDKEGNVFYRLKAVNSDYETGEFWVNEKDITLQESEYRQKRSGMPDTYMTKVARDFDWTLYGENTELARKILNGFIYGFNRQGVTGYGLYIYSKTRGSGKTLLSCCIANEVLKRHDVNVKFITISDYLKKAWDKSETAREELKAIREASLLIVDDIGATAENKESIMDAIFNLVDFRYKRKLATIYTSNLEYDELKCGDRAIERIYEDTMILKLPEVNIRRLKAKKYKQKELKNMLEKAQELGEDTAF